VLVGVASGLGAGVGGTLVYLFGRGGRSLLFDTFSADNSGRQPSPRIAKFMEWANRRGSVVVFFMSAMLNPAFAPMAIAIGAIRYRMPKFFLWCTTGNVVKSTIIAYCGYFGLGALFRLVDWIDIF
jgi:membrane protein DedA with SNARE-associated domain